MKTLISVLLLLTFSAETVSLQRIRRFPVRSLEGVVVDTTGGARWMGIVVESGGRRHTVTTANNPDNQMRDPVIIGDISTIGTRVRVTYNGSEPWGQNETALYATKIVSLNNQTTASSRPDASWLSFWRRFRGAVNTRNKSAVKALMSSERDFFSGGGGENRDEWIRMIDNNRTWRWLQRSVASGTMVFQHERGPSRITKDRNLIFVFISGAWRFVGVMGD